MIVLEARPPAPAAEASNPPDAGSPSPVVVPPSAAGGSPPSERTFAACTASGVLSCDFIYVSMQEEGTDLCVQLTLDNCGGYQRPGLPVDVPLSWRLTSGSVGTSAEGCVPDVYDANSVPVLDATGAISWNDTGRRPSELVIDITVEPSRSPGVGLDGGSITLATGELVDALPDCTE